MESGHGCTECTRAVIGLTATQEIVTSTPSHHVLPRRYAAEEIRRIEQTMVEAYLRDPDFDRSYPIGARLSLLLTPPPRPLDELVTPTMFIVATRRLIPEYEKDLFRRLPSIHKKLVEWTAASSGCARTRERHPRIYATGSMKPYNRSWHNPASSSAGQPNDDGGSVYGACDSS